MFIDSNGELLLVSGAIVRGWMWGVVGMTRILSDLEGKAVVSIRGLISCKLGNLAKIILSNIIGMSCLSIPCQSWLINKIVLT